MKFKEWMKEWWGAVLAGFICFVCCAILVGIAFDAEAKEKEHQEWYNNLSASEKAEYDAEQQAKYNEKVYEYDVLEVYRRIKQETNRFGGVIREYPVYVFTYMDGSTIREEDAYRHFDDGYTQVKIGDANKFVVDENGSSRKCILYLTKETMQNLQMVN
ncbi:MAG: hypothetical protein IJZ68_08070 [Bacteroidaceae bacterium]|nr:hypothetical protein [Bacteroidaceae bacterium]